MPEVKQYTVIIGNDAITIETGKLANPPVAPSPCAWAIRCYRHRYHVQRTANGDDFLPSAWTTKKAYAAGRIPLVLPPRRSRQRRSDPHLRD